MSRPKALAVCTTALGDTLLCTPALAALAKVYDLDALVHRQRIPVILGNPNVQLIYPYRNNFLYRVGLSMRLGKQEYDRLVILHANDGILKLLGDLKFQKGANIQGWDRPELNLTALQPDPSLHVVEKRMELARWAGAGGVAGPLEMYLTQKELAQGRGWLDQKSGKAGKRVAALCPGAAHPYKMWPADRYAEAGKALAEAGFAVMVIGSKAERKLVGKVASGAGKGAFAAAGLDLRLLAAVLARVDLVISNCTGPLHLAQAAGAPVLGLYGPTDPETIGPRGPKNRVLKVPRTCDECVTKSCEYSKCMEALRVEEVVAAALSMLEGRAQ